MATSLLKRRSGSELGEQLEEIRKAMRRAQELAEADRELMRRALVLLEQMSRTPRQEVKPIPEFGKVRITGSEGVAAEVTGNTGVILARDLDNKDEWLYTVLVDSVQETYMLPHKSLEYLKDTVCQSDVYSGKSLPVSVDGSGVSRVRSRAPRGRGR